MTEHLMIQPLKGTFRRLTGGLEVTVEGYAEFRIMTDLCNLVVFSDGLGGLMALTNYVGWHRLERAMDRVDDFPSGSPELLSPIVKLLTKAGLVEHALDAQRGG